MSPEFHNREIFYRVLRFYIYRAIPNTAIAIPLNIKNNKDKKCIKKSKGKKRRKCAIAAIENM